MEIKLIIKYFWSVVYIVHSYNLHNMRYRQKCTLKKCNSHFPNLIKFWLNKGVNYTQDSMVLTLTNNKKKSYFGKKTLAMWTTRLWISYRPHKILFTLVSGQVDIYNPANLSGIHWGWKILTEVSSKSKKVVMQSKSFTVSTNFAEIKFITLITQGI